MLSDFDFVKTQRFVNMIVMTSFFVDLRSVIINSPIHNFFVIRE
jgi:hypothetical protein